MTDVSPARRRALIDAYKRTPRAMGVYRITNRRSGRCLVASSRDLHARLNRHRMNLKFGTETLADLQRDYEEHGADAFEFEILDTLEPLEEGADPAEDLAVLEALWLEKLAGADFYGRGDAS